MKEKQRTENRKGEKKKCATTRLDHVAAREVVRALRNELVLRAEPPLVERERLLVVVHRLVEPTACDERQGPRSRVRRVVYQE